MSEQTFIGKGKQQESGRIMATIKLSDALKCVTEYKDEKYIKLFVVQLKNPDNYGHTHTVYSFTPEVPAAEAPAAEVAEVSATAEVAEVSATAEEPKANKRRKK